MLSETQHGFHHAHLRAMCLPLIFLGVLVAAALPASAIALRASDVEVTGPIESIADSVVTVQGQNFVITPQTRIRDYDGAAMSLADLAVGMLVEAEGDFTASGVLIADKIELEDSSDGDIETEGPILALSDSTLTVGGLTFEVTASTRVDGPGVVTFADLALGDRVRVKGQVRASGALVAERIRLRNESGGGDDHDVELHGTIEALSNVSITVSGRLFALTAQTVVFGHNHQVLPLSALAVGQFVEIKGAFNASGVLVARSIEMEDVGEGEVELTGTIESLRPDGLTVSGVDFLVTDQTVVLDDNRQPIAFSDLAVGMLVEIRGVANATGQTVATRIQREDGPDDEIELRATLDFIGDSLVVALGRAFLVGPATRITSNSNTPIPFTALAAGQLVEIRAERAFDGSLRALTIEREDGPATAVRLRAVVTAVGTDSLDVLGVRFGAAGASVILANGSSGSLADVSVGQSVDVDAIREAGGLRATRIRILRAARVAGLVSSTGGTSFALPGVNVAYNSATLITDAAGRTVAASNIVPGATVQVFGISSALGTVEANRILLMANAGTVAGAEDPDAPVVALSPAFPNPTRGPASIRLTLLDASRVSIDLVDMLGRTVAALPAKAVAAGSHQVALPTEGVPAGRYIVRVLVDGQATSAQTISVIR